MHGQKPGIESTRTLKMALNGVFVFCALLGIFGWARQADPFVRYDFTFQTPHFPPSHWFILSNRTTKVLPLLLYADGRPHNLLMNGLLMRKMAEAGLACLYTDNDPENAASMEEQYNFLLRRFGARQYGDVRKAVWIGRGKGAEVLLKLARKALGIHPAMLICVLQETGNIDINDELESKRAIGCPIIIVSKHESADALRKAKALVTSLRESGNQVDLITFEHADETRASDVLLFRQLAERSRDKLLRQNKSETGNPLQHEPTTSTWRFFWPSGSLLLAIFAVIMWEKAHKIGSVVFTRRLIACTVFICGVIAGLGGWTWIERHAQAGGIWLTSQNNSRLNNDEVLFAKKWNLADAKPGQIRDYIALADYNRGLVNWELDPVNYELYVLSPCLRTNSNAELGWRQNFWSFFFPKIRSAASPDEAANFLVKYLRTEVEINSGPLETTRIQKIWDGRSASPEEFETLYVAALRSVGLGARLNLKGHAEILDNGKWQDAPRPPTLLTNDY